MKYQKGLSLIELMVSLIISSLLMLVVVQLFLNTSSSDRANTALARIQENGRVALELIGSDARRAGFQGCIASRISTDVTGSITLPDHAVASGVGSVTFRYAVLDSSAGVPFPADEFAAERSCSGDLDIYYLKTAKYSNCNGNLCLNDTPILAGAQLTDIRYAIPNGSNTIWTTSPNSDQLEIATAVQLSLEATNADQRVTREFTGTYEFRNRTQ